MRLFAVALAFASPAYSQSLSIVVTEGDAIPGVGAVTRVDGVSIASDGSTFIEVDTDNADTDADTVLLRNGALFLRENDPLVLPAGATIGSFDGVGAGPGGSVAMNLFLDGTSGSNDDSGIFVGSTLVLQEGSPSASPSFSPGTEYIGFFDAQFGAPDRILVVASIDDPAIGSSVDRALVILSVDGSGNLLSEAVVAREGEVLAGQTEPVADFETGAEESDINAAGQVIFTADLEGDASVDRAIYLDGTLLAQEGSPSPVPGRNWGSLFGPEVDLNDAGDYVFTADLDGSTADDDVIVRNGAVVYRAGDSLPDIAPFSLTDFGGSVGVWITPSGDILWFGDWDDPDTSRDEGIFLNDRLVLQEGVTSIGGNTIVDLSDITEQIHVAPDGSRMLVEGAITGPSGDLEVVVEIAFDLGTNYCAANPNSTGAVARVAGAGSLLAVANDLTLLASSLPSFSFGYFLTSRDQGLTANPGGSQGNLCLGGAIGRYVGPGQIQNSGPSGGFSLAVDLTQQPTPSGFVVVQPGETWNFQAWYRDSIGGTATSNFTDGLEVLFE